MNFGKAFSYQFQDPKWIEKILITALISLIPLFGGFYLVGWTLADIRRLIDGEPYPMPETDFGGHFIRGLKWAVIQFVYSIPMLIVVSIALALVFLSGNNTNSAGILFGAVCCINIIVFLYAMLLAFATPVVQSVFIAEGESIGSGFKFSQIIALFRASPGAYGLAFLGSIIAGIIASLGSFVIIIGALVTMVYAQTIIGHLIGQAYKDASSKLNPPA